MGRKADFSDPVTNKTLINNIVTVICIYTKTAKLFLKSHGENVKSRCSHMVTMVG